MKLSEFLDDKNLFQAIEDLQNFPFIGADADTLDMMLKIQYGEKTLFSPYAGMDQELTAKLLVKQLSAAWENYIQIAALSVDVNKRREVSETTNTTEDRTNNKNDVNKVAAFNSPTLIENDSANSETVDDMEGETVREMTDSQIDPMASYNMLNALAKDSIIQSVMRDVAATLTLSIY